MGSHGFELKIFRGRESLCEEVAKMFLQEVSRVLDDKETCTVILGGGRTPVVLHGKIVETHAMLETAIEWSRVRLFLTDERCVPSTDPRSNSGMVRKTLVEPLSIPGPSFHPMEGSMDPERASRNYQEILEGIIPGAGLDLALLGLGPDGHTASLFPGHPSRDELERWVVPAGPGPEGLERMTTTPVLINQARQVWFLVSGPEKESPLRCLLDSSEPSSQIPAGLIRPQSGKMTFLTDIPLTEFEKTEQRGNFPTFPI